MRLTIGLFSAATFAMLGCDVNVIGLSVGPSIVGSGVAKREARDVGPFSGVDVSATLEASVTIGAETSVTIEGDDNLVPLIKTEVRDGRLVANYEPGHSFRTKQSPRLTIVTPKLDPSRPTAPPG